MAEQQELHVPILPYAPADPQKYWPPLGLIGCGAITRDHLTAYKAAEYNVVALCDINRTAADSRRQEYFPQAAIFEDYHELLAQPEIAVVDIATHPRVRAEMVEAALKAGKHVLSQKPFVLDLAVGRQLVALAQQQGVKLAVNQNGRWAPHYSYIRQAVASGVLGEVQGVHMAVHWNHNWVKGTEFESVKHLILYDFAIHWFDMLTCLMGAREPRRVYASLARSATQDVRPALLGQALVEYEGAQASLVFDGDVRCGPLDTTYVAGSRGTATATGADLNCQQVTLCLDGHEIRPELRGRWFSDGFHGTMGELLRAIEEGRDPDNSAEQNLRSLSLCFAAVASAERGEPVVPGSVEKMPDGDDS